MDPQALLRSLPPGAVACLELLVANPPPGGQGIRGPGSVPAHLRGYVTMLIGCGLAAGMPACLVSLHATGLGELVLAVRDAAKAKRKKKRGTRAHVADALPEMRKLRDEGMSFYRIGRRYGISADAVRKRFERNKGA